MLLDVTLVTIIRGWRQVFGDSQRSLKSIVIGGELKADGVLDNSLAVSVLGNPANGVVVIVGYLVKEPNHRLCRGAIGGIMPFKTKVREIRNSIFFGSSDKCIGLIV